MRVVLTGGGTGGHIYPAMSVAEQLKEEFKDVEILYIGAERGLENDIVPKAGISFSAIKINGFRRRKLSLHNVKTVYLFLRGVMLMKRKLRQFRPHIVIGTGGYVCGPVMYAAHRLNIPTIVHEQNVLPGLTNRFLSRYVDCVAVSFKGTENQFPQAKRVLYTGNPRATSFVKADSLQGYDSLGIPQGRPIVVMVGGSGGAKSLNDAMVELAGKVERLAHAQFVFVTGKKYYDSTMKSIEARMKDMPKNLTVLSYIYNMPEVLSASSLIINRAGASFLAEIMAVGVPAILVPSPNVTNNHQEANARWLEKEGAAEVVLESELNGDELFERIHRIMSDSIRREYMSKQSQRLGNNDAAGIFVREVKRLVKESSRS